MGARQDNRGELKAWLKRNRHKLTLIGLPSDIAADCRRFLLVVQNGEDQESGWDSSRLNDDEATALLSLLQERFDDVGWDLIGVLERR